MNHGMSAQVINGRTVDKAEPTHKCWNCADSFGAPLGWQLRYSRRRAPQFDAMVLPRLWQPARRAYMVASIPFGQSCDIITTPGIHIHWPMMVPSTLEPSTKAWSGRPRRKFMRV